MAQMLIRQLLKSITVRKKESLETAKYEHSTHILK